MVHHIARIIQACFSYFKKVASDCFPLTSFQSIEVVIQEDLIRLVRGDFATALKELLQHGLLEVSKA